MRILVFGADGLGTFVGGFLTSVHGVTLVAHDPHAVRVSATGFGIIGIGSARISPAATTTDTGHSANLVLVMVKPSDAAAVTDALADCDVDTVLSLRSGLTEETLASYLDAPVLAETATHGARLVEPSRVECTNVGRIVSGAPDGGPDPLAECVGKAFCDAGLSTLAVTSMPRRRWEKLTVNAGTSAVTALARVENDVLAGSDAGELVHRAVHEMAHAARSERVSLPNRVAREAADRVVKETIASRSPILQDVTVEK